MNRIIFYCLLAAAAHGQVETKPTGFAFQFYASAERANIWGRGADIPRHFFPEFLPALFTRTLNFPAALPGQSSLEWIFTGDEGGVTVRLEPGKVRVAQRYYDSYGLSETIPPKARYPQRTLIQSDAVYSGDLRSVTLELDHKLGLNLSINGRRTVHQTCLMDLRRHQLAWTPSPGSTAGFAGALETPATLDALVRIRPEKRFQKIYGFGGILSAPAYAQLSPEGRAQWWKLIREYNLLIHREYPNGNRLKPDLSNFDTPADATPHYYGDNFPNGEITDFDYIRRIRNEGGHVLFEFWSLPPWARGASEPGGSSAKHGEPIIGEYVRAMVGYCRILKERTGAPPEVVGIQNEVVQPAAAWHRMILALRAGLDQAGFQSTRIHMPDNGRLRGGIETIKAIQLAPDAWRAIDYAATHVYDFQDFFEDPDGYDSRIAEWQRLVGDKPFLSTELTVNSSAYQSRSYRVAFAQAQLYHKNMALMNAAALIYCWTLLDAEQPSFTATRSLFAVDRSAGFIPVASSYQLRTFGAYSRRLREGMVRIDTESPAPNLLVTAYAGEGGRRTVVLLNRSTAPQSVRVEWPGASFTERESASPYSANRATKATPGPVLVQPGEIATLSNVSLAGR